MSFRILLIVFVISVIAMGVTIFTPEKTAPTDAGVSPAAVTPSPTPGKTGG